MLRICLLIATIGLVACSSINAACPKGCTCVSISSVVECNTVKLEPFGMHVFNLKIANPAESLVLKDEVFRVKGLENVNTISIENATILKIEESAFSGLPLLSALHIINCNISALTNSSVFSEASNLRSLKISNSTLNLFENVKSEHLEELVLSGNKLEVISNNAFSNLPSLTYINLSHNIISKIDSLAFSKLLFLQEVFIGNNNITNLDSDLFKNNIELVVLDLSHNPLKKFNINVSADLEKLVLKSCQLDELSQNISLNLDYLSYLDLSNNKINFTNTAFNRMNELDYVNLSNNNLTTLDSNIFRINYKLQKIILDNNNFTVFPKFLCSGGNFETYLFSCKNCGIRNLPVESFKQFPAVVTLNLAHNHITSANLSAFHYTRSLIELDLSYNNITSLNFEVFYKSTALEKLSLAGNRINSIDPSIFDNNRVLKTLDLSYCSLHQLWNPAVTNALTSLRQLILIANNLTRITLSDLAVINSIEVLDISNNPIECDTNLKDIITWLNERDVSPVIFKTHEEMYTIDSVIFEGTGKDWSWTALAKEKCSKEFYEEKFFNKHSELDAVKITTKVLDDTEYHYGDFDSDEDSTISRSEQFGKDIAGMRITEIMSPSRNKEHGSYSFLWPTLVFIFTSLSVLIIAVNIMLIMLRSSALSRNINLPHIKMPQWNSGTKLKKHSGSVYQPLSEEKYDSCISITSKKEPVSTHNSLQNDIA